MKKRFFGFIFAYYPNPSEFVLGFTLTDRSWDIAFRYRWPLIRLSTHNWDE
jgi:hypothetical protein